MSTGGELLQRAESLRFPSYKIIFEKSEIFFKKRLDKSKKSGIIEKYEIAMRH